MLSGRVYTAFQDVPRIYGEYCRPNQQIWKGILRLSVDFSVRVCIKCCCHWYCTIQSSAHFKQKSTSWFYWVDMHRQINDAIHSISINFDTSCIAKLTCLSPNEPISRWRHLILSTSFTIHRAYFDMNKHCYILTVFISICISLTTNTVERWQAEIPGRNQDRHSQCDHSQLRCIWHQGRS